jgi:hypothetical protein
MRARVGRVERKPLDLKGKERSGLETSESKREGASGWDR